MYSTVSLKSVLFVMLLLGTAQISFGQNYSVDLTDASYNIAYGKAAYQSSTSGEGYPSRAVDGDTYGKWSANSVTHTAKEANPWWEVDLGSQHDITGLDIHNRTDCCQERFNNIVVYIKKDINDPGTRLTANALTLRDLQFDKVHVKAKHQGRYIRIVRQSDQPVYLSLAEVVVYGERAKWAEGSSDKLSAEIVNKADCSGSRVFPDPISAASYKNIWRINVAGTVERSTNRGGTFHPVKDDRSMTQISAVNDKVAWALKGETIFRTLDGGNTWTQTTGYGTSISAVSADVAWVVNGNSRAIWRTSDGGKTWEQIQGGAQSVSAPFENFAWVVNDGRLWFTKDGGKNWELKNNNIKSVSAISGAYAWCIDNNNNVVYTLDYGKTWTKDPKNQFYYYVECTQGSEAIAINHCGDLVLLSANR